MTGSIAARPLVWGWPSTLRKSPAMISLPSGVALMSHTRPSTWG